MQYKYAQIDDSGVVYGISYLSGDVTAPNMIPLGSGDEDVYMGWKRVGDSWQMPEPDSE